MIRKTIIIFILFVCSKICFSQNVNLIIQVNEKLVYAEISGIYLIVNSGNETQKMPVSYYPGDLVLDDKTWSIINADTLNKFSLQFDYSTYKRNKHQIGNFSVELTKEKLKQPYLILNIYDFRSQKYKHWYQWQTDKDFLAELTFPNSGIYIRRK